MSTKTTFKRIALVAVAALGFGVLTSVAPATAANGNGSYVVPAATTLTNTNTTLAGRVGQQVSFDVTGTWAAVTSAASAVATVSIAAAITTQPATSAVYASIVSAGSAPETALATVSPGLLATGSTIANGLAAGLTSTGTASSVATMNYATDTGTTNLVGVTTAKGLGTITFTPTVAGTYSVTVWNEFDRSWGAFASNAATAASQASLSGSESYKIFTVNVASGVASVTLAATNTVAATTGSYGALIKVSLKDAAGNASVLAPGEVVTLTPSGSGDISKVNGSDVVSAAGAAYSLSSSNFNSSGIAWINMLDGTAESVSLTASINGGTASSVSIGYKAITATAAASAPYPYAATRTAYLASGSATSVGKTSTTTFRLLGVTAADYNSFQVTESLCATGLGSITGYTTALGYNTYGTAAATTLISSISVTASCPDNTSGIYTVTESGTKTNTVSSVSTTAGVLSVNAPTVNSAIGASNTITATLTNIFGAAYASQSVSIGVTGKNPTTTNATAITDANGKVTFTLTDANTNTATQDVITFTSGSAVTSTVSYGTNAVATVTLTSAGDTDVIPGTTTIDIDASATGATGVSTAPSAVVKNAAGALLAGVPVTFTVTGLVGAEVHTTKATVYTDTTGTAVTAISSYAAGKATVTATAGGISATDSLYFAQATALEARTITAVASGNSVIATVKDRYGNTIPGVTVNATRTGAGSFNGVSTATGPTGADGTIEFIVSGGDATVKVAFSAVDYGQTAAAAGYDIDATNGTAVTAYVAGTTTTAQKGLGSSLAPVGINSATASVTVANVAADNAQAATDAAAEATDAANAATDAANAAAEAADAATAAAQDAADAVAALSTQVSEMVNALKKQITALTNLVIKIQKKVKA
jgi:hypothetical protein